MMGSRLCESERLRLMSLSQLMTLYTGGNMHRLLILGFTYIWKINLLDLHSCLHVGMSIFEKYPVMSSYRYGIVSC